MPVHVEETPAEGAPGVALRRVQAVRAETLNVRHEHPLQLRVRTESISP